MDGSIKGLKESAERSSKRAHKYFIESHAIMDVNGGQLTPQKIKSAIALNDRAIDELKRALNVVQFLNRYVADKEH